MELYDVRILPPGLAEVARVVGVECVLRLLVHFTANKKRSGYVYVPKSYGKAAQKLAAVIGKDGTDRLMKVYGGSRIFFSSKREVLVNVRIAGILELRKAGFSALDIAWFYGVSDRYVRELTRGYGRKDG